MQKTVVLIIDDQPIFRAGVRKALAHHNGLDVLEIVDCDPGQGQEAVLRTIEESSPHVALLDVQCSSGNGTELCKRIIRNHPSTRVVLLSSDPNADDLFDAMKIGAVAYLSKDSTVEILSDAIQRAASGEYSINDEIEERPRVATRLLERFEDMAASAASDEDTVPKLTQKEIQFLNLIAEDNSNRQIAAILGIDEDVVRKYVTAILRKLNAGERAHAVMMDLCNNWQAIQQEELSVCGLTETGDPEQAQPIKAASPKAAKKTTPKSRNNGNSKSAATSGRKKSKGA